MAQKKMEALEERLDAMGMNWRKEREKLKAGIDRVPVIEERFEKLEQIIGQILSTLEQLVN